MNIMTSYCVYFSPILNVHTQLSVCSPFGFLGWFKFEFDTAKDKVGLLNKLIDTLATFCPTPEH